MSMGIARIVYARIVYAALEVQNLEAAIFLLMSSEFFKLFFWASNVYKATFERKMFLAT